MNGEDEDTLESESDGRRTAADVPLPGGDFRLFVTRLSFQAMLSLGLIENPLTGTKQVNLAGARMLVDDLAMLIEKTRGNLDDDEAEYIEKIARDLEMHLERMDRS